MTSAKRVNGKSNEANQIQTTLFANTQVKEVSRVKEEKRKLLAGGEDSRPFREDPTEKKTQKNQVKSIRGSKQ